MKNFVLFFVVIFSFSCAQNKYIDSAKTEWQKQMNADFKDATKSPLKPKDLKTFRGLDFYIFDSIYVVKAKLLKTPNSKWFNMKTTTKRLSRERIYGIITFKLKGTEYKLNVYQGEELMQLEDYSNYLFLPFLDHTNGESSYGGGRYIDLKIPENDILVIDFNKAYNPYCAYNDRYSCPIVPRENYLDTSIKAGVKAFKRQ